MKHKTITIKGADLEDRWSNDNVSADEHAGLEIDPEAWYEVSWPEHVISPQFNCDCDIVEADLDNVQLLGDGTCICDKCWHDYYPGIDEPTFGWTIGICNYHRDVYHD